MKKYSVLLLVFALVFVSLACQSLSGVATEAPALGESEDGGAEVQPTEGSENSEPSYGAESEFPLPDGAINVQDVGGSINFQAKMSMDEAMKFYMDSFTSSGYTERALLTVTSETTFSMVFDGHESGQAIVVQGVDFGDGTVNVNIRLEDV
jgi:hypothetical protein